jgi:hypothetical protein
MSINMGTRFLRLIAGLFVLVTFPLWFIASLLGWMFTNHFFLKDWANWIILGK